MAARVARPSLRSAVTSVAAKVSGSAVSSVASGESLVSMLRRTRSLPERSSSRQLRQGRGARARHRLLVGELLGILAAVLEQADVVGLDFGKREAADRTGRGLGIAAAGV